ncbi:MAG: DNA ligase [Candidatus Dactylopiibacterium sp.]|nr:DNA ligase [Candidatus Dactylopiibacterium sp.]
MRHAIALLLCCLALLAASARGAAPAILLAEVYRPGTDPAAYLVSEKLDGVRAIWDGHTLVSRSGQILAAPPWFLAGLPATPLDGELWAGRGRFEWLAAAVSRLTPVDAEWREIRYMIFELPGAPGSFRERAARMRALAAETATPWLQAVAQTGVASEAALRARLAEVVRGGGEGLMLHLAQAPYLDGRSPALLKLKPWLDAEARVVAHLPGKGRHAGRMGALLVEAPDGRRFRIGTGFTDAQRASPPAPGSLVTYRYHALTRHGLPRTPSFLRVRDEP